MRVTIAERLGIVRFGPPKAKAPVPSEVILDDAVPVWVEPERVVRLTGAPACMSVPVEVLPEVPDDPGPPRVTGHMEWLHKSVPVLVIHGRDEIPPEEYAAGRRR